MKKALMVPNPLMQKFDVQRNHHKERTNLYEEEINDEIKGL